MTKLTNKQLRFADEYMRRTRRLVGDKRQFEEFEICFFDKLKALELICKHLGPSSNQQIGADDNEVKTRAISIPAVMEITPQHEYLKMSEINRVC